MVATPANAQPPAGSIDANPAKTTPPRIQDGSAGAIAGCMIARAVTDDPICDGTLVFPHVDDDDGDTSESEHLGGGGHFAHMG